MKNLSIITGMLLLCACEAHESTTREVYVDTAGNEVVARPGQTIVHDDNGNALMNGIIIGHLLSSSSHSGGGYSGGHQGKRTKKTTIVNNHTTIVHAAPRPRFRYSRSSESAPRQSYRPSASRSRTSMGSRATRRR